MNAETDDAILLKQIASPHEAEATAALGEIYDRYSRLVFSLAVHIVSDSGLAEEITQDVFVQVWHKANTYHPDLGKVSSWLTRVARNRAIDMLRRLKVRPEGHQAEPETDSHSDDGVVLEELEKDAGAESVEDVVEFNQQRMRLLRVLANLPEEQRQVLALAYFQGLTQQEIALTLNAPLGTVKTRIRMGLQKMRALLAETRG
jgi:RNA polymerase sigma-70 factor (ECF subfamily)